jgi:hypothetical protein
MPASNSSTGLRERTVTQRNITIAVAILVAVPTAYGFHLWSGAEGGDFLLLMLLGVGVPTAFDEFKENVPDTLPAVAWVLGACLVVTVEFAGLYVIGTEALGVSPFRASVGTFLLVWAMNHSYLVVTSQAGD